MRFFRCWTWYCVASLCLFCLLNATSLGAAAQPADLFIGLDDATEESTFLPPPRENIRPLLKVRSLIERQQWREAVAILGELITEVESEDFLIRDADGAATSLRLRTRQILGSIPAEHRESFRVRYTALAQRLLDQAIESRNRQQLRMVASRYFYTLPGYEAAMMIGHLELADGQPYSAASWLSRIVETDESRQIHDPEASVLLAMAALLANDRPRCRETLIALKERQPDEFLTINGKEVPLYRRGADPLDWLEQVIGSASLLPKRMADQLLVFKGGPARTGYRGVGVPLPYARWSHSTARTPQQRNELATVKEWFAENEIAPVPAVQPMVVGDTVVMRTVDRMIGIDFRSGELLWQYPPETSPPALIGQSSETQSQSAHVRRRAEELDTKRLAARLLSDSVYGQAASDGKSIFIVPRPGVAGSSGGDYGESLIDARPGDIRKFNELVAIDVSRQGALKWRIGGRDGFAESKMAGTTFLGPPLPMRGQLFCIGEQDDLIKLFAIDPATGKLQWSQQLADSRSINSFRNSISQRLAGATPSAAGGILVCPTGNGSVVAIDLTDRALLWGVNMTSRGRSSLELGIQRRAGYAEPDTSAMLMKYREFGTDSAVTIANGRVMAISQHRPHLFCLDLQTGKPAGPIGDRSGGGTIAADSSLFLAGVFGNRLMLCGRNQVQIIDFIRHESIAKIDLTPYGLPSGRGYVGNGSLFLPTTDKKVIEIGFERPEIIQVVPTHDVLGNLIRFGDDVISHGIDRVSTYPQQNIHRKIVDDAIQKNLLGAREHFLAGQLMIQQQRTAEAADHFMTAWQISPAENYESALCMSVVQLLRDDYDVAMQIVPLIEQKLLERHGFDFIAARIAGLVDDQREVEAIELLLSMVTAIAPDSDADSHPSRHWVEARAVDVDAELTHVAGLAAADGESIIRCRADRWISTRLEQLAISITANDPDLETNMVASITEAAVRWIDSISLPQSPRNKHEAIRMFPLRWIDANVRLELAKELFADREFLRASHVIETIVGKDESQIDPEATGIADSLLLKIELLLIAGDYDQADRWRNRLDDFSDAAFQNRIAELDSRIEKIVAGENGTGKEMLGVSESPAFRDPVTDWPRRLRLRRKSVGRSDSEADRMVELTATDDQRLRRFGISFDDDLQRVNFSDCFGGRFGGVQFSEQSYEATERNERSLPKLAVANGVLLITRPAKIVVADWFRVSQSDDSPLWDRNVEPQIQHAFGSPGFDGICVYDGKTLACHDTFTGDVLWQRTDVAARPRVTGDSQNCVFWLDRPRQAITYDVRSGRRIADRSIDAGTLAANHHGRSGIFSKPLRKASADKDKASGKSARRSGWNTLRLARIDLVTGETVWQRDVDFDVKWGWFEDQIVTLGTTGKLEWIDLASGETKMVSSIELTTDQQRKLRKVHVQRVDDQLLVIAELSGRRAKVEYQDETWTLGRISSRLIDGPRLLINGDTGAPVWDQPAQLENFEFVPRQPMAGPFLFFGRRLHRRSDDVTAVQLIALDRRSGAIANEISVPNAVSVADLLIQLVPSESASESFEMFVEFGEHRMAFTLESATDGPPAPVAYLTNQNSLKIDLDLSPFDLSVRLDEQPAVEDQQILLRQRAVDAAARMQQFRAETAAQLEAFDR